jgi:hypothetical protein
MADVIEFSGVEQVYSASGVDLTLLRQNLRRSPEERWQNNARALAFSRALQQAVRRKHHPSALESEAPVTDAGKLVELLSDARVEFVVVGGQAMRAHGSAHITEDLDLCYHRTTATIAAALAPLNPYLRGVPPGLPSKFDPPSIQAGLNFTLTTTLGDLDLLGELPGLGFYPDVARQAEELTVFGHTILILSLDGLIAAKKAAGRTKDVQHLLELEELKKLRDANL